MLLTFTHMLGMVEVDPLLNKFVMLAAIIILTGITLRRLKQPYVIAYIITGIILGPHGFGVVNNQDQISYLGSLGLILLMFFIGMEISLPKLLSFWRIIIIGTLVQILLSLLVVSVMGQFFSWPLNRIIMLAFVICLSSTAVVIKLLQDNNETHSVAGRLVIGILLAQDISIVPMLIILSYVGGEQNSDYTLILQLVGGSLFLLLVYWLLKKKTITFPFDKKISSDHEIQVFLAFAVCFGLATISSYFGLSSALGAFAAGLVISSARATHWVHHSLHAFRVVFVALFFVSIGMIIDLTFLFEHWKSILAFLLTAFVVKQLINTFILRIFRKDWGISLYGGALLSQIGEFSFILGTIGYQSQIISSFAYQMVAITIALSLLFSPFWISSVRWLIGFKNKKRLLSSGRK